MRFVIETAKPIKAPLIIRFGVLMYDDDDELAGEYEISIDLEPYVDYQIGTDKTNININAVAVQQNITSAIAEMQIATLIANGFIDLDWTADEEDNNDDEESDAAATGDTTKLQPVLPEGN